MTRYTDDKEPTLTGGKLPNHTLPDGKLDNIILVDGGSIDNKNKMDIECKTLEEHVKTHKNYKVVEALIDEGFIDREYKITKETLDDIMNGKYEITYKVI